MLIAASGSLMDGPTAVSQSRSYNRLSRCYAEQQKKRQSDRYKQRTHVHWCSSRPSNSATLNSHGVAQSRHRTRRLAIKAPQDSTGRRAPEIVQVLTHVNVPGSSVLPCPFKESLKDPSAARKRAFTPLGSVKSAPRNTPGSETREPSFSSLTKAPSPSPRPASQS